MLPITRESELRRINSEGYFIRTDSDVEELFAEEEPFQECSVSKITRAISVYGGSVRDDRGNPFPKRWNYWCQHCCHNFKTAPFGIPTKYDDRRDRYFCVGRFCADSCAKGYMAERGLMLGPVAFYFTTMIRKAYGKGWGYRSGTAPPRTRLVQFGGDLTIEQFRAYATSFVCYVVPPNVLIEKEQLAEVARQDQVRDREHRNQTICRVKNVAVVPRKPLVRRRPGRVKMTRVTPLPKKTYTLDTFWNP